jgi:adenylate cyclase
MTPYDVKRKLTAILSADVKGYSRLMGDDEEWTVRTLNACKEVIGSLVGQHRGRVVDAPGDNLLAEFSSVVDALRCAVEIQQALRTKNTPLPETRRMEFRIGINLGDVIEEGSSIYGDGVNIAARIESTAQPGGISLSGTAYDQVKNKVPLVYDYAGEETLKNIADPVRVYRVLMEPRSQTSAEKDARAPENTLPLPDKPSIAVLPFVSMSDDPKDEFFSDGITEDIITLLAKSPYLFVIARTSAFTYKGKAIDVKRVSEELGVRYVLEGSVRRSGQTIRITAQLIDALTGYHLWADRYDRDISEVFAIQDEIALKIMKTVHVKLPTWDSAGDTGRGTANVEAYLKDLEGRQRWHRTSPQENALARKLCEQAIALDPNYARAYEGLAFTHLADAWIFGTSEPKESARLAVELGEKAVALDESSASAHAHLGTLYAYARRFDEAIDEVEKALASDQNSPEILLQAGAVMMYSGRAEEAISFFHKVLRLDPLALGWHLVVLAQAYRMAGRYEEAYEEARKAVELDPRNPIAYIVLTVSSVLAGREQDARAAAAELLKINPRFSVRKYAEAVPYRDRSTVDETIDALHKAGLS